MFLGLRTAAYHAPDLAKARAWDSEVLGTAPYFDEPFNVGGYELGLHPEPGSGLNALGIIENPHFALPA